MRVYKFGGASVKDAFGVKNVLTVLQTTNFKAGVIVISAMGKTTNALEKVVQSCIDNHPIWETHLSETKQYHVTILDTLFPNNQCPVYQKVTKLFESLRQTVSSHKNRTYDFVYDQVVSFGELLSTTIISEYLILKGIPNEWVDARTIIKTDQSYRDAQVDWEISESLIKNQISKDRITITQGFIASDANNFTTTLGREGSDYSAAIFAYCLQAFEVDIWKDVPGVLNGDPRHFEDTKLLDQISYEEAIELAYYGASVIHPKTLQPLQRKSIPLYVKSFLHPKSTGTVVSKGQRLIPEIPCYIQKRDQILMNISSLDFSFIAEQHISNIFQLFHKHHISVSLIQNSAISFSVCLDDKFGHFDQLLKTIRPLFKIDYQKNVCLFTIRHFTDESVQKVSFKKDILLKQSTKETYQIVVKQ